MYTGTSPRQNASAYALQPGVTSCAEHDAPLSANVEASQPFTAPTLQLDLPATSASHHLAQAKLTKGKNVALRFFSRIAGKKDKYQGKAVHLQVCSLLFAT